MPNDDGGVSAKLAGARATLTAVNNSNVSARQSPYAPHNTASHKTGASFASQHGADHEGGTLGAELDARADNVTQYVSNQ